MKNDILNAEQKAAVECKKINLCFPLFLAYWALVLVFYMYVGIPAYIIKKLSPKKAPRIDRFFDKAWDKIMEWHNKSLGRLRAQVSGKESAERRLTEPY